MLSKDNIGISFIIPALNEEHYIWQSINAIKNSTQDIIDYEIAVVDNGSTDSTVEISNNLGARIKVLKDGHIASMRNSGAKLASYPILAFIDADCLISKVWVDSVKKYFFRNDQIVLGFRTVPPVDATWVARSWDLLFERKQPGEDVDWVATANMIVAKDTFMSIGGFDEALETHEDMEFCARAKKKGIKIIYSNEAEVVHLRPPGNLLQFFKKEIWHGKEVARVFLEEFHLSGIADVKRVKNLKVVLYALLYLFGIIFGVAGICKLLYDGNLSLILWCLPMLSVTVSILFAAKVCCNTRSYSLLPGLAVVLIIYGVSRAISLAQFCIYKWVMTRTEV